MRHGEKLVNNSMCLAGKFAGGFSRLDIQKLQNIPEFD
jgi:hypothetical protein